MRLKAWDLETTSLSGMIGRVLVGCVKDVVPSEYGQGAVRTYRADDRKYRVKGDLADDSLLVKAIADDVQDCDVVITHNGKLFDRKFLNARLLKAGYGPLKIQYHVDTMWIIRTHLRISSKLDNAQKFMGLPHEKTPITWDDWLRGQGMDSKALDTIATHCQNDVIVLEEAYWKLLPYMRDIKRV